MVNFRNVGDYGLQIKNYIGFEVLSDDHWLVANQSVVALNNFDIAVKVSATLNNVSMIRYNWYTAPCLPGDGILNCAIYDVQHQLPAIPFILNVD